MVTAGDILDVEVQAVRDFGLFCQAGEQQVLVLIPETSWVASYCSCKQFAIPGDRFRVQVLAADAASGKVSASVRALHPDPWPSGQLARGAVHLARVVRRIEIADRCGNDAGLLLELLPGAYVVLCERVSLSIGSFCLVKVVASNFSNHAVRVALCEHAQS